MNKILLALTLAVGLIIGIFISPLIKVADISSKDNALVEGYFTALSSGDYESALKYTSGQAASSVAALAGYEGNLANDPEISVKVLSSKTSGPVRISDVLVTGQANANIIKVYEADGKIFKTEEVSMFEVVPDQKVNDSKIVEGLNSVLDEFIAAIDSGDTDTAVGLSTGLAQKSLVYSQNIVPNLPPQTHSAKLISLTGADGFYLGEYTVTGQATDVRIAVIFASLKGGVKIAELWQIS